MGRLYLERRVRGMLRLRICSIVSLAAFCVFLAILIGVIVVINTGDYNGHNSQFAKIEATQNVEAKSFTVDSFDTLLFFSQELRNERTLFTDEMPRLTVVNSDKYIIEVRANKDLLDKLDIFTEGNSLHFGFKTENYNDVKRSNKSYKGLFVDCSQFDVTVYAPISKLKSNAELDLDFQACKTSELVIIVDGEIRNGKIYDVDSSYFGLSASGNSNVNVSGNVSNHSEIIAQHNSKIDATLLDCAKIQRAAYCQLFGLSYVRDFEGMHIPFTNVGFLLTVFLTAMPILSIIAFVVFRIWFFYRRKEADALIELDDRGENL